MNRQFLPAGNTERKQQFQKSDTGTTSRLNSKRCEIMGMAAVQELSPQGDEIVDVERASKSIYSYLRAKEYVISRGFQCEIDWQTEVLSRNVTERVFLEETAWVILSAGMREAVVRKVFPAISEAFLNWSSAESISASREKCVADARQVFNHDRKIAAIAHAADLVKRIGLTDILRGLRQIGPTFLETFSYIGPITCLHLAKNLGVSVAKPDRHLVRIAAACGYESAHLMCSEIAFAVGDAVAVVDLIIWRYATLSPEYLSDFQCHRR